MKAKILLIILIVSLFSSNASAATNTPEDYNLSEFPQWALDLRRAEIISIGSMPFMAIGVTMAYGGYLYFRGDVDEFPNPFDKSSEAFSEGQQITIFISTLGVGLGIGVADFIINLIRRKNKERKLKLQNSKAGTINIINTIDESFPVIDTSANMNDQIQDVNAEFNIDEKTSTIEITE